MLQDHESKNLDVGEIGGLGFIAYLGGDSIMLLDHPALEVVQLPAMNNARQILLTDSALYCSVENYVCRLDTISDSLQDVIILDNEVFNLYKACGNSFFIVTADDEWSSCILADPDNETYSEVLQYPGLIRKITANEEFCFVWIEDNVCLIEPDQQLATLFKEPSLRDIVLTPSGLLAATDEGLWVVVSPSQIYKISGAKIQKLWFVMGSLYLLGDNGTLIALDNFAYPDE